MPTPSFVYARNERLYAILESTYGVTPNASGTSSLGGSNHFAHISCTLDPVVDKLQSTWKTGSRGRTLARKGRVRGTFNLSIPLMGSGVAGTPPDADPLFQAAFGATVVTANTSVLYKLNDTVSKSFTLARFRQANFTPVQQLAVSCLVRRVTWNLGQNLADLQIEGVCMWVLDNEQFSTADSTAKAGLTTFPTEPATPTINGVQSQGFLGNLSIDGNVMDMIQTMTVTAEFGWDHVINTFGSLYPTGAIGRDRMITASVRYFDNSEAALQNLRAKALSLAPMQVIAQIGNTAGNTHTLTLKNGQFGYPGLSESDDRFAGAVNDISFAESTPGAADEIQYAIT
jgi:hypothetical protein